MYLCLLFLCIRFHPGSSSRGQITSQNTLSTFVHVFEQTATGSHSARRGMLEHEFRSRHSTSNKFAIVHWKHFYSFCTAHSSNTRPLRAVFILSGSPRHTSPLVCLGQSMGNISAGNGVKDAFCDLDTQCDIGRATSLTRISRGERMESCRNIAVAN